MLHALVLAAETFPVGDRAENARAEQAIALRLEGAVVDGFRLGHFPMRPAPDLFRGRQADANGIEVSNGICHIERARTKHVPPLSCGSHASTSGPQLRFSVPGSQQEPVEIVAFSAALRAIAA